MNITFKKLLTTSGIFSIVMTTLLVGIAFTTNQKMTNELGNVANTGSLLGTQMEADMMHDALRADVFSIELSLASYNIEDLKTAQTDIEEHSKIFNDAINSMLELNQDEKISAAIASVKPKLANYIAAANRVKELSATNEAPSKKIFNIQRVKVEFLKDFSALEEEMGNLSELIESKNAATKKSASQFASASSASLMTLGIIVICVMFVGGLFILRKMTTILGGDVETAADVAEKVAQGESVGNIQLKAGDETSLLAKMQMMSKTVRTLVNEVNQMANEHHRGDIDVKINTQQFKGEFKLAAEGVNEMVQAHVLEKSQLVEVVDAFGRGDFKADLPPLPGKKANTNVAINKVRSNLVSVINAVNDVYQAHEKGDIDEYLKTDALNGDFVTLAESVNKLVESHIDLSQQALNVVKGFGEGNFDVPLPEFPGKKAYINQAIESTRSNIKNFVDDMQHMSAQHDLGDIDVRMDEAKFAGTYKEMAQGVNNMASGHIDMNKKAIAVVQAFGDGDFEMALEKFPGKKAFINHAIEGVRSNLEALSKDSVMLSQAALDGRVLERADATQHKGDFRIIVEGINATLDTIVSPIKTVKEAVDTIHAAANEISNGNTDLAQRTEDQAASFEKTAASMKVLGETVRKNANSANEANTLAAEASGIAVKGGSVVGQVVSTMNAINESAHKIEDIISVIDGIAFQTNILALNAAVEAARAGEQGRGFAVVAGEVRNLAQRSASAAKEIKDLISHSVERTAEGTAQVEVAGETMNKVVESVKRVSDFIREISSASSEQIMGIDLVNYALGQMNQDTQQNATMVEQAARAAESLLEQANALATSVEVFKLDAESAKSSRNIISAKVDHAQSVVEMETEDSEMFKTGTY